jgi:hypothetical protein
VPGTFRELRFALPLFIPLYDPYRLMNQADWFSLTPPHESNIKQLFARRRSCGCADVYDGRAWYSFAIAVTDNASGQRIPHIQRGYSPTIRQYQGNRPKYDLSALVRLPIPTPLNSKICEEFRVTELSVNGYRYRASSVIATAGRGGECTVHITIRVSETSNTVSTTNKLLLYKTILKTIWTYGIQLWGTASTSNIEVLERFQSKVQSDQNLRK